MINSTYQKIQFNNQIQYNNPSQYNTHSVRQQIAEMQIQKIVNPPNNISVVESATPKKLDFQLMHFEEKYSSAAMNKLYTRVETNDPNFATKKLTIEKNFRGKSTDYIKRELL